MHYIEYALIIGGAVVAIAGVYMGKYSGKKPKDEDTKPNPEE